MSSKQGILFIDDDETAREVARYNLERAGHAVTLAGTAEEGVASFSPQAHAVVITDLRLPGKDGLWVLAQLKAQQPEVAVVVITAFGDVQTAVRAMREGAYDFIPKPFNRDQLALTVGRALERAHLLDENRRLSEEVQASERSITADW